MSIIRVIDIETTGLAPPAEIIEVGRVDLVGNENVWTLDRPLSRLYKPINGIPPETKAVHHITEEQIGPDAEPCTPENLQSAVMNPVRPNVLAAHNCAFEQSFIGVEATDNLPWICTYKCALRIWPDAPAHSNQVLRYWRELSLDPALAMPPHRAAPDAWVTAHLLAEMLQIADLNQLIKWTAEPKLLPTVPFGKHRNEKWASVPQDYLVWLIGQSDLDKDVLWNAKRELARRESLNTTDC